MYSGPFNISLSSVYSISTLQQILEKLKVGVSILLFIGILV